MNGNMKLLNINGNLKKLNSWKFVNVRIQDMIASQTFTKQAQYKQRYIYIWLMSCSYPVNFQQTQTVSSLVIDKKIHKNPKRYLWAYLVMKYDFCMH